MGRVIVEARIENLADILNGPSDIATAANVRAVDVKEALIDTGASNLGMPSRLIEELGLKPLGTRYARIPGGSKNFSVYGGVRLNVMGRNCICDVLELPDECPVLIGQVPLEILDFLVDPVGQKLIGNPAHNGEQMVELY
jgi:predicted aspartyl protease